MATYTADQVEQFYDRIHLPKPQRHSTITNLPAPEQFTHLTHLMQHSLLAIPFENLNLHYSPAKSISTDPTLLFNKMISPPSRGRGGYCMENNALLGTILTTLGYNCMSVGARVFDPEAGLLGFNHMINFVTIGEDIWIVDIGFGGNGIIRPLQLPTEKEVMKKSGGDIVSNLPGQHVRVVWDDPHEVDKARRAGRWGRVEDPAPTGNRSSALLPQRNSWVLESMRHDKPGQWEPMYAFVTQRFAERDYAVMNWFTSTHPETIFTRSVWCVRMLERGELGEGEAVRDALDESARRGSEDTEMVRAVLKRYAGGTGSGEGGVEIIGQVILLDRSLKIRVGNKNFEIAGKMGSEEERVEALSRFFGISLSTEETSGIHGAKAQIQ